MLHRGGAAGESGKVADGVYGGLGVVGAGLYAQVTTAVVWIERIIGKSRQVHELLTNSDNQTTLRLARTQVLTKRCPA